MNGRRYRTGPPRWLDASDRTPRCDRVVLAHRARRASGDAGVVDEGGVTILVVLAVCAVVLLVVFLSVVHDVGRINDDRGCWDGHNRACFDGG